jgi:TolB protein
MQKLRLLIASLAALVIVAAPVGSASSTGRQLSGSATGRVTAPENAYEPAWSPDARRIAFTGYRSDDNYDVYVMDRNGKNLRRLTKTSAFDANPSWSSNGRIAFTSAREGRSAIYSMKPDGSDLQRITRADAQGSSYDPAWSPDGTQLAFVRCCTSDDDDTPEQIFVVNADGSGERQVTQGDLGAYRPAWSPDGSKILFTVENDDEDSYVEVIGADGTGWARLTQSGLNASSDWSPDGRRIAVNTVRNDGTDIDVMNPDGSGMKHLIGSKHYSEYDLAWSRDGRHVAFVSWKTDSAQIYIATGNGKNQKRLTGVDKVLTEDGKRCTVVGTEKADVLVGTSRYDVICGRGGADKIRGGGGEDTIDGGTGSDRIDGGPGKDVLIGGAGADVLIARDGVVDNVDGGRGTDTVSADRDDWVRNAEAISYR